MPDEVQSPTAGKTSKGPPAESTPLWKCLQEEDVAGVQEIIKQSDVNIRDSTFGWTPCHFVANAGHLKLLKTFLDAKAKPEVADNEGNTPLMLACRRGHLRVAEFLVGRKVAMDVQNNNGWTALIWAAINGHEDIATSLMGANSDFLKTDNEGRSACMWAARHGHLGLVESILACGINLGIQDHAGLTVMDHAQEHMEMRSMIAAVAELNDVLLNAVKEGDTEGVRFAIEAGANLELRDEEGWTPLMWAALSDSVDMVQLVIRHGANPSLLCEKSETVEASGERHMAVGEALTSILGSNDRLLAAAKQNDWEAAEEELKIGAFINVRDENLRTAFMWAGKHASAEALSMLVGRNALLDERDVFGRTAVHYAVESHSVEAVSLLFYLGASFDLRTYEADSVFHIAVRMDDGPMMQLLLASNSDLEDLNADQHTPLMIASANSLTESIHTLITYKADVNAADASKRTAFILAVVKGQLKAVSAMLEVTPPPKKLVPDGEDDAPAKQRKAARSSAPRGASKAEAKKAPAPAAPDAKQAQKKAAAAAASGVAKRKKIAPAVTVEKRGDDPQALITAATQMRAEILSRKVNPMGKVLMRQADVDLRTPLALSVHFRQMPIFHRLLEDKADMEASNTQGNSVLMEAIAMKQREAVARLLELKAKTDKVNKEGKGVYDLCEDPQIKQMLDRHEIQGKLPEPSEEAAEEPAQEGERQRRYSKVQRFFRLRMEKLPTQLTGELLEQSIRSFLKKQGAPNALKVDVVLDAITSRPRGYAYVDFADAAAADLAMRGDGQQLNGQVVRMLKESTVELQGK